MIRKIILSILGGLFYSCFLYAQITTEEPPFSLSIKTSRTQLLEEMRPQILSTPNMMAVQAEDKVNDASPGGPLRFAYPVKVRYALTNSGVWQTLKDGGRIWRLKVKLPGALSTNALYDRFWLPKGAKFYVYSEETGQSIGAITSEFLSNSPDKAIAFSTGLIYGETVTFEYYQPAEVRGNAIISISRIDYGYRLIDNPYTIRTRSFGDSGGCQVNVNCPEGENWRAEKDAIARIMVVSNEGSGWCSCALINNTNNDNTPYVLTADHCLQNANNQYLFDAINNPNVSRWVFYWNYEHPGCSNGAEPPHKMTVGATVVANNSSSDFALLRLTQDPRNLIGFTPYYLGWDRSGNPGAGGVGIHHPKGDVKKISTYNNTPTSTEYLSNSSKEPATHWRITWSATGSHHGITEGGSSGSPLLNNNHRVIGQLHGGHSSCSSLNSPDWYGKFSVSWTGNNASDPRRRLKDWLDPLNKNVQTLNGKRASHSSSISISGPSSFYNTAAYTIANLPAGSSVQWSSSSNCLRLISGQGTATATFRAVFNTSATITARISGSTSTSLSTGTITADAANNGDVSFDIWNNSTGRYIGNTATGSIGLCPNTTYHFRLVNNSGCAVSDLQWTVSPYWRVNYTENNMLSINTNQSRGGWLSLKARTCCGSASTVYSATFGSSSDCQNNRYSLYPNPAQGAVTLEWKDEPQAAPSAAGVMAVDKAPEAYEVQLWSGTRMLRSYRTTDKKFQFDIGTLPRGIYIVRIIKGKQTYSEKLIKE